MLILNRIKKVLFLQRRNFYKTENRAGYIVLVPEIGENQEIPNNLLTANGLPDFNSITVENCLASIGQQASCVEKLIKSLENDIPKIENLRIFEDIINRIDQSIYPLETTWGIAKTLYLGNSTLMPTKSYLNIHERASQTRALKFNNKIIYDAISNENALANPERTPEECRLLQKYLIEGKLNGVTLSEKQRLQLNNVLCELTKERNSFKNKVETARQQFSHTITKYSLVRDFPPDLLQVISSNSNQPTKGPWRITLRSDIVKGFLEHCPDRSERWNIWQADVRKAAGLTNSNLKNSVHLEKIRALRRNQAQILGFETFAAMSMETKMIGSVEKTLNMFNSLREYSYPAQLDEIQSLKEFSRKSGCEHELELCDIPYWKRKQLKAEIGYDEEYCKEYFPISKVFTGLFYLAEQLFKIKFIEKENVQVWHPYVKYFDIYDEQNTTTPIAGFYLDCYSKENSFKERSGWMVNIRNRSTVPLSKPSSALIFNFDTPLYGKPCLLSINDIQSVFKNFGTQLQHSLTKANYSDLAGLSNIEWDAAEICGYVLMMFLNDTKVLKNLSGHYKTGELISDDNCESIKSYLKHMSGYELSTNLYNSHLDLELHSSTDFWSDIVKRIWPLYITFQYDKKDSHPCSMTDIFSGNWGAAHFSHIYSKLLAADIYNAFIEEKNDNNSTGIRFRDTFLSCGGTIGTSEVFRRFRGRDPSPHALLKLLGLYNQSN